MSALFFGGIPVTETPDHTPENTLSILDLPVEIVLYILSYVSVLDLTKFSLASRQCRVLANDSSLSFIWQCPFFRALRFPPQVVGQYQLDCEIKHLIFSKEHQVVIWIADSKLHAQKIGQSSPTILHNFPASLRVVYHLDWLDDSTIVIVHTEGIFIFKLVDFEKIEIRESSAIQRVVSSYKKVIVKYGLIILIPTHTQDPNNQSIDIYENSVFTDSLSCDDSYPIDADLWQKKGHLYLTIIFRTFDDPQPIACIYSFTDQDFTKNVASEKKFNTKLNGHIVHSTICEERVAYMCETSLKGQSTLYYPIEIHNLENETCENRVLECLITDESQSFLLCKDHYMHISRKNQLLLFNEVTQQKISIAIPLKGFAADKFVQWTEYFFRGDLIIALLTQHKRTMPKLVKLAVFDQFGDLLFETFLPKTDVHADSEGRAHLLFELNENEPYFLCTQEDGQIYAFLPNQHVRGESVKGIPSVIS